MQQIDQLGRLYDDFLAVVDILRSDPLSIGAPTGPSRLIREHSSKGLHVKFVVTLPILGVVVTSVERSAGIS